MSAAIPAKIDLGHMLRIALVTAALSGCGGGGTPGNDSPGDDDGSPDGTSNEPAQALPAPDGLTLTKGHGRVTAAWTDVPNAEGYHLYYAEDDGLVPDDYAAYAGGTWVQDVTSPHAVSGLAHGATYYFIVTAFTAGEESGPSATRAVTLPGRIANAATSALNDSGFDRCADAAELALDCPLSSYPGQDAESGRDAHARAGTLGKIGAGAAGFDFTKISHAGIELSADAAFGADEADWACTLDNVTGLLWEVRPDVPGSLRYRDSTYSWRSSDAERDGGDSGVGNGGVCSLADCDTESYVDAVNGQGLCGFDDWRMPTAVELASIVHHGRVQPAIDTSYFPDVPASNALYWTATPFAKDGGMAWSIDFADGQLVNPFKGYPARVRLVRADD